MIMSVCMLRHGFEVALLLTIEAYRISCYDVYFLVERPKIQLYRTVTAYTNDSGVYSTV